ncbi:MAG TPA: hypothetical protein VGB69_03680 [Edaphobacter sp.]
MRNSRIGLIAACFFTLVSAVPAWAADVPTREAKKAAPTVTMDPEQLIRDTVYNELHDHEGHGYWQYSVLKKTSSELDQLQQVETTNGPVHRLVAVNGEPLTNERRHEEEVRLDELLSDPGKQRKVREQYADDEKRIGRIMQLLPVAFLYEYEGLEGENYCLSFRPNPAFHPPSIEARVFHAMQGKVYVNARWKRLARLDGHLIDNIDFGYGILGRLYKGGWFNLERAQISQTDWKTEVLEVHVAGRAVLFKTIAKDTREERSGFREVPRDITMSEAKRMLDGEYDLTRRVSLPAPPAR